MKKDTVLRKNKIFNSLKDKSPCIIEDLCPTVKTLREQFAKAFTGLVVTTKILKKQKEEFHDQIKIIKSIAKNTPSSKFFAYSHFNRRMSKLPHVCSVHASITRDNIIDLWTIVDGDLYEAEELVINEQLDLCDNFPDLSFDFLILPKLKRKLDEIIPSNSISIYNRDK